MKKYTVFKYSGQWYGECPHCMDVMQSGRWRSTLDLLELHARKHLDIYAGNRP